MMRNLFLTLAVALFAMVSCGTQNKLPPGGVASLTSAESGNDQFAIYKVRDDDDNPAYILAANHTLVSFNYSTLDVSGGFGFGDGKALFLGENFEDAMESLDELIALFEMPDGTQKEYPCWEEESVTIVLHRGILGRSLSIGDASLSRGELKSLRYNFKSSRKVHENL